MKLLLMPLFVFAGFQSWSQTEKRALQAGLGGLPIIYFDKSLPTGYSVRMNIGYFTQDRLAKGLMTFGGNVSDINSVGVSAYSRYYFIDKRTTFFVEGSLRFGRVTYEFFSELNGLMSSMVIGPGASHQISKFISIELLTQFARLRNESFPENSTIGNTFIPTIGAQLYIPD